MEGSPQRRATSHAARVARLRADLAALPDLAVAFSGGVDSSVLLHAAHAALGERAVGVIADSPSLPRRELAEARAVSAAIGARLVVLRTEELAREGYRANDGLRCYWCKRTLFEDMRAWARGAGFTCLAFGEVLDDRLDDRPGARAASELAVTAPLSSAGLSKEDVRRYAREHGLAVHDKPASACLASRIPRGTAVTRERLARVEEAEERLRGLGLRVLRVRDHGTRARVEVGAEERDAAEALRGEIAGRLLDLGFAALELATYRRPALPLQDR